MPIKDTTPVPNSIISLIATLSEAELKICLVILRQTLGFRLRPGTQERKRQDWISSSQFQSKTGLSRRSIVAAIGTLAYRNIIVVANDHGKELKTPSERKGKLRLYYRIAVEKLV